MGGQVSNLLFSPTCEGKCLYDDTVSLKQRMAAYGVASSVARTPQDVMAIRVQLYVSATQVPTTRFLRNMSTDADWMPCEQVARAVPWLAHQLHERFHPDALQVLPHELSLLFLRGQCPYGAKIDTLCSVVSSFVAAALVYADPKGPMFEARTRVYHFGSARTQPPEPMTSHQGESSRPAADCQCALWEAHNYVIHRSQQGNEHAMRWLAAMYAGQVITNASTLPDTARWGYVLCGTRYVPLHANWWKRAGKAALLPLQTQAQGSKAVQAKASFVDLPRPEEVTQAHLLDIVAMTEAGATVDLSDFPSLQTGHVERLCKEWLACGRVPRKLLLKRTLVDGGLILSRTILSFLSHPQVYKVDVRDTSFLECADPALLQRLILEGALDRLLFYPSNESLPAWLALSPCARIHVIGMLSSLTPQ